MTATEIRNLREKLGLTQDKFAQLVGVSFATVNRWENGSFKPSSLAMHSLEKLSKSSNRFKEKINE